jgi:DNA ligase D-like protein (predicted polymerase)
MQKNVPKYTPEWVPRATFWAEASQRDVTYALCNDRRTLLWFANQRAVEYHPSLARADQPDRVTHLVLDLDPPEGAPFSMAVGTAGLVRQALAEVGLEGAVKTSGAKGVHVFVPIVDAVPPDDAAAATRAIAARAERLDPGLATTAFIKEDRGGKVFVDATRVGGATVVAAYSPRVRPGCPVSFPVTWDDLGAVAPADFTLHTARDRLGDRDPWAEQMPAPQRPGEELVAEGRAIPVARVQAMHEGKRRARARRRAP